MSIFSLFLAGLGTTAVLDAPLPPHQLSGDPARVADILSDEELARLRGGFAWNGVSIQLGAEVRSYLDDALVMQTNVSWSEGGAETTRFVSGALEPATADALRSNLVAGSSMNFAGPGGVVYFANDGRTAFAHRTDDALQNVVLNAADNTALRQEMDVRLDVANMGDFQGTAVMERIGTGLADMLNQSLAGGP